MSEKITEKLIDLVDQLKEAFPEEARQMHYYRTLTQFEMIKFALANDLSESKYKNVLNNSLLLAIGLMSCVGSALNRKDLHEKNIESYKELFEDSLKYISDIEKDKDKNN